MKNDKKGGEQPTDDKPAVVDKTAKIEHIELGVPDAAILAQPGYEAQASAIFDFAIKATGVDVTSDYINFPDLEKEWVENGLDISNGVPIIILGTKIMKSLENQSNPEEDVLGVEFMYQKFEDGGSFKPARGITATKVLVSNLSIFPNGTVVRIKHLGKEGKSKLRQYDNFRVILVSRPS